MGPRRKFRFLKELSEGNFGKVYMAEMITGDNFSSVVAIKLLHGKWLGHEEIVQRSRDEARVLGKLHHRNIVRVEDLTSINGQCAVVMEYLEGVDVKNLVNWCNEHEMIFPRKVAFEVAAAVGSALEAAYYKSPLQGGDPLQVIHRDIKPSNVMVTVAGEVKVLDFGTAQASFDDREAKTQALAFGSAAYMAPERLLGDPDAPSGDIFSVGVTLYEMLAHKGFGKIHIRPEKYEKLLEKRVDSIDLSDLEPEIAEQVRQTLRLVLAYEPDDRPDATQVQELMEALAEQVHDSSIRRFCRNVVVPARNAQSPVQHSDDPLTGSTLFEDRSGFDDRGGERPHTGSLEISGDGTGSGVSAARSDGRQTWSGDKEAEQAEHAAAEAEARAPADSVAAAPDAPAEDDAAAAARLDEWADDTNEPPADNPFVVPPELMAIDEKMAAAPVEGSPEFNNAPTWHPDEDDVPSAAAAAAAAAEVGSAADWAPSDAPTVQLSPEEIARLSSAPADEPVASSGVIDSGTLAQQSSTVSIGGIDVAAGSRHIDDDEDEGGGGGIGKFIALAAVVLLGVGVIGAGFVGYGIYAKAGGGGSTGGEQVEAPEGPKEPVAASNAVPGGRIEVGAVGADAGTLALTVSPAGRALVSISSVTGFKQEWDGSGELELVGLPVGTYKTKVAPRDGKTVRGTVEVVAEQRCAYTFDLTGAGEEWQKSGCE